MNANTHDTPSAAPCLCDINRKYTTPVFRGTLKAREGRDRFGRMQLDSETALKLGRTNVGLFVECCPSFEDLVECFYKLNDNPSSMWIVIGSTKQVVAKLKQIWRKKYSSGFSDDSPEQSQNVMIVTPENLKQIDQALCVNTAGILIVDYACHIHKCRGFSRNRFNIANDRPQKIVDFRTRTRVGDWSAPVLMFTNKPAISVNTQPMLSPYCLEAFRFIDGKTMSFGEL